MGLPRNVLNRLRIGRPVAAQVIPQQPGNVAWVYVWPLIREEEGYWSPSGERRFVHTGAGDPIRGFIVRYLEVEQFAAEQYYENQRDDLGYAAADIRLSVDSEEELIKVLQRWLSDFASLHAPSGVGYLFLEGPSLLEPPPKGLTRE